MQAWSGGGPAGVRGSHHGHGSHRETCDGMPGYALLTFTISWTSWIASGGPVRWVWSVAPRAPVSGASLPMLFRRPPRAGPAAARGRVLGWVHRRRWTHQPGSKNNFVTPVMRFQNFRRPDAKGYQGNRRLLPPEARRPPPPGPSSRT